MKSTKSIRSSAAGFTLVEMIVIVGVISVVMVSATAVMPNMLKQSRADASTAIVLNALRVARDRAISDRRNMDVRFLAPNRITIVREEIIRNTTTGALSSSSTATTNPIVMDVTLENNQRFTYFTGMADTPDLFGRTNAPLAFGTVVVTVPTIMFTSEGTLVNSSGDPINGTVFLGNASDPMSARAVTVFGATAVVRAWKWDGTKWTE